MKRKKTYFFIGTIFFWSFLYWQNNGLVGTKYSYNTNVPSGFCGYRILQISDLQNKVYGKKHNKILSKIKKMNPHIILITGDLLDRNRTNIEEVKIFISSIVKIAPVYFVSGNHEHQAPDGAWNTLYDLLISQGVHVMDNKKSVIERNGDRIELLGLADKSINPRYIEVLSTLVGEDKKKPFQILLSHRPELLAEYAESEVDLVFCGHAHGGQIRLPWIGGIFAPHQGFFPKLTEGIHKKNKTSMVISRGLGNSTFPIRIFNRPELVEVTLEE